MRVFVFLGPPGVGKGTQASMLVKQQNAIHLSSGAILREEIAKGSALGKQVKEVVDGGQLVSDPLLFQCFGVALQSIASNPSNKNATVIIDGVPRTLSQIELLDAALASSGAQVAKVVSFVAEPELLVSRFASRWSCSKCGEVYSFSAPEAASAAVCGRCGAGAGTMSRRKDDAPENVRVRLKVYRDQTEPVAAVYRKRGILVEVDGLRPVNDVYQEVLKIVAN